MYSGPIFSFWRSVAVEDTWEVLAKHLVMDALHHCEHSFALSDCHSWWVWLPRGLWERVWSAIWAQLETVWWLTSDICIWAEKGHIFMLMKRIITCAIYFFCFWIPYLIFKAVFLPSFLSYSINLFNSKKLVRDLQVFRNSHFMSYASFVCVIEINSSRKGSWLFRSLRHLKCLHILGT